MKADGAATIFQVKNVEAAIKYYVEVLGFDIDFRYNDFVGVVSGNVLIYLSGPANEGKKLTGQGSIYIFCDEVDEYYNDITAKGALLTTPIDNRQYGMRDFGIEDPDGNFLSFGKETGS